MIILPMLLLIRILANSILRFHITGPGTCLNLFIYSRSYAEDVTSVTSGASQGPHSFNLVFVCVFVCLCHAWRYPVSDGKKS